MMRRMELDGVRGRVIRPDDAEYEGARRIFNGAVDRKPALVVQCAEVGDVVRTVRYAREGELPLSVRAGGHNFAGHALCDGGVVIDLRPLRAATVDPGQRLAVAQAGLTWGQFDAVTQRHGLAAPGGSISTVGVAGYSLGSGLGWLGRPYGLAGDSLLGAEVVTADGEVITVGDRQHPELFWALRGGCGNFGVVTALRFRVHPVSTVVAGTLAFSLQDAPQVLRAVVDQTAGAPDTFNWTAVYVTLPPAPVFPEAVRGQAVMLLNLCSFDGEPWRPAAAPLFDTVGPMPYADLQRSADAAAPEGAHWDVRSEWLRDLDDEAMRAMADLARAAESPLYEIVIRPLGGAIARRAADATPFSFRHAGFLLEVIAGWFPDDPRGDQHRAWMQRTWERLAPLSAGGPDVSHIGVGEGVERVRAAYAPATYERLVEVKRRYDPDNVFRSTQNIPPMTTNSAS